MRRAAIIAAIATIGSVGHAQDLSPEMIQTARRHYRSGVELMQGERWDAAVAEFRNAIAIDALMALAHYNIGQSRMAQKRFVEAVTAYQDSRAAFEKLGSVSEKDRERRDRARRDEIDDLKNSLARIHTLKVGNTERYVVGIEERIRTLEAMQSRDLPGDSRVPAELMLAVGSAYFRQDKLADAEREYLEAVRINPKLGEAHNNLAVLYMMRGQKEKAEASVKAAEKARYRVNPKLKEDIRNLKSAGG